MNNTIKRFVRLSFKEKVLVLAVLPFVWIENVAEQAIAALEKFKYG